MKTYDQKNEIIRRQIISAANEYKAKLAGHVFLYVYGDSYFEVVFFVDRFLHLTGVNSRLNGQDFYDKATSAILTTKQFFYDADHLYVNAKKKLPCLIALPSLTDRLVCVVRNLPTKTLTYKLGVTNIDFTLGLTENTDLNGNIINDWYVPRTLRVRDHSIEKSPYSEFID